MYELIIKRLISKYKIYMQIDEYLSWKAKYSSLNDKKAMLVKFAQFTKKHSVEDITVRDIETYRLVLMEKYSYQTGLEAEMRNIRCFIKYHKKRGLNCINPYIIGDSVINYHLCKPMGNVLS